MTKRLTIAPGDVILDGHSLLSLRESQAFQKAFGAPTRRRDIKMHPSGTRVAMVWDELGLVAYEDQPEGYMSHLHLAFDPIETPERPSHPTKIAVEVNAASVTGYTTERGLPRVGATPILADFGRRLYLECERYVVDFAFEKHRDSKGRMFGTRRLASVSFSWRPSPSL